ncbi:MAG: hypothetical protein EXQ56_04300 [Acidobacteria bacterium]|nr:hypothetical protein [Acidobacteriota bacterium]
MSKRITAEGAEVRGVKPKAKWIDRGDWVALFAIAALGAMVRWSWMSGLPAILHPDSDSYFEIAQRLWNRGEFGDLSRRTPLYPLLLWITGKSGAGDFDLTLLVQHALGVGTALLTYLTARGVVRYRVPSLFAGLAVAAAPVFILTEHSVLSESLYTFLLVAAGYFLLAHLREQCRDRQGAGVDLPIDELNHRSLTVAALFDAGGGGIRGILCGVALGLACLTRPIALLIFPLWLVVIMLLRGRHAAGRFAATAGIAWLAVLLPLLIRNQQTMGRIALTESTGRNLISVTDLQVDYAASEHKDVLSIYHRYLPGKRGPDAVVVYSAMPELRRIAKNPNAEILEFLSDVEIDRALADAALDSIWLHPLDFLWSRWQRLPLLFLDPSASQWYALRAETYVPLVEFTGRTNPEMTSRTVVNHPLQEIDFPRAASVLERWQFPFGGVWFLALAALGGIASVVAVLAKTESRSFAALRMTANGGGLLIFLALAASLLVTILMQPPNLRYRLPTLPWEILLAAAGLALVADTATQFAMVAGRKFGREIPCWIPNVAVCCAAIGLFVTGQNWRGAPGESAIQVGDFVDSANRPEDGPPIIRQMPLAGRTVPMIYWRGDMPAPRNIETQAAVPRGGAYHLRAAFSCGEANCANAQLRLVSFDAVGTALGTPLGIKAISLAQERTDNDWFWEQIDERVTLPRGAARVRVELTFEPGQGSVVIPFLALSPRK